MLLLLGRSTLSEFLLTNNFISTQNLPNLIVCSTFKILFETCKNSNLNLTDPTTEYNKYICHMVSPTIRYWNRLYRRGNLYLYTGCVVAVRNNQLDQKWFYLWKRRQICLFYMAKTRKDRRALWRIKRHITIKWQIYLLLISYLFVILCLYICVCDISEQVCTEGIWM
jgi:hypothetical protein